MICNFYVILKAVKNSIQYLEKTKGTVKMLINETPTRKT